MRDPSRAAQQGSRISSRGQFVVCVFQEGALLRSLQLCFFLLPCLMGKMCFFLETWSELSCSFQVVIRYMGIVQWVMNCDFLHILTSDMIQLTKFPGNFFHHKKL